MLSLVCLFSECSISVKKRCIPNVSPGLRNHVQTSKEIINSKDIFSQKISLSKPTFKLIPSLSIKGNLL